MFQVSALRLVDRAILPSVIIIATKILAIFVACFLFSINWQFNLSPVENNFLILQFDTISDLSTVVNFSDTIVTLVCGVGFIWALFQANHPNINKTHPTVISKIYNKGKEFWLTTTGQVYHQTIVWLGLSWLVLFMVLVNVYQGVTSQFVLGVSLVLTLGLTVALYDFARKN